MQEPWLEGAAKLGSHPTFPRYQDLGLGCHLSGEESEIMENLKGAQIHSEIPPRAA